MKPVENPKVFMSYAWGTDDYQEKVIQFCTRLQSECGVDVVLDKWSMDAGDDTYDFMERCVKDPSVKFVIMLLDKNYADKADSRLGGVGAETQIISSKVYTNIAQNKFIPVVFERGTNGEVYKPAYLQTRLHFDLTNENANDEFIRLVKHLYGEKTYPIPPRGNKPDWVSQPTVISPIISKQFFTISHTSDNVLIKSEIKEALNSIRNNIFSVKVIEEDTDQFKEDKQKFLDFLDSFVQYRDATIMALKQVVHKDYFEYVATDFFEEFKQQLNTNHSVNAYLSQAITALLHEIFIYTIALLWEAEEYAKVRDMIISTYIIDGRTCSNITDVFYSAGHIDLIDNAKKSIDNKEYYSGLAQLWTEHVMSGFSLDQIAFADLLVHNLSILEWEEGAWYWFPKLYVYGLRNPIFTRFTVKMKSAKHIIRLQGLFGTSSQEEICKKLLKMSKFQSEGKYRYSNSFDRAPLMLDYIKTEEIGKLP